MFMLLLKTQIVQLNQLFMVLPETTSVLIIIFKQHILPYNCNQNQKRGEKEWGLGEGGGHFKERSKGTYIRHTSFTFRTSYSKARDRYFSKSFS